MALGNSFNKASNGQKDLSGEIYDSEARIRGTDTKNPAAQEGMARFWR
jgi:hypothetical protein